MGTRLSPRKGRNPTTHASRDPPRARTALDSVGHRSGPVCLGNCPRVWAFDVQQRGGLPRVQPSRGSAPEPSQCLAGRVRKDSCRQPLPRMVGSAWPLPSRRGAWSAGRTVSLAFPGLCPGDTSSRLRPGAHRAPRSPAAASHASHVRRELRDHPPPPAWEQGSDPAFPGPLRTPTPAHPHPHPCEPLPSYVHLPRPLHPLTCAPQPRPPTCRAPCPPS